MKKVFIFAILIKSSIAISVFQYHNINNKINSESLQNINLYNSLNTNACYLNQGIKIQRKVTPISGNCYNITSLMSSYYNQNNKFIIKAPLITLGVIQCPATIENKTDMPSIYSAKMALAVLDNDRKYKILITDISGQHTQVIVISNTPITSLAWNKSNTSLAYVSYESGKPVIYIQNIYTSKRYIVSNFDGSNSSPTFDGNSLLVSLSKDYGTNIYQISLQAYTSKKTAIPIITTDPIDTEADTGNGSLIFTSNKKVKPQIYLKLKNSTQIKQISIGVNNTTGRISGDGTKILYIHGSSGKYALMYYNIKTGTTSKIDSGKILSGSFAADNTLIAYIKNNQVILHNPNFNNTTSIANLKYREIFDIKWSK